jgi:hypothetical protein
MKSSKKADLQQVVVLNKALKLAEGWVKQMNTGPDTAEDDVGEEEIQNRPARLGLGAKFVPHSKFAATLNPVEKKLRAKLNAAKRQSDLGTEEACSIDKDIKEHKCEDNDIDSDDSDSRANAFSRKQTKHLANSLQSPIKSGKKRKRKN